MGDPDEQDPVGHAAVRFVLSIESGAPTISGRLALPDGSESGFFGWLELISRIERELDAGAARGA